MFLEIFQLHFVFKSSAMDFDVCFRSTVYSCREKEAFRE